MKNTVSNGVTYENRVKQFEQDQKRKKTVTNNRKKKINKKNPYLRARHQILNELPQWRRNEVLTMESKNDIENHHYMTFVRLVAERGDVLSN